MKTFGDFASNGLLIPFDFAPFLPGKAVLQRLEDEFGFLRSKAGDHPSRKRGGALEDGEKGKGDGMGLFMLALHAGLGGAGKLHEKQGSVVFPSGKGIRAESDFLGRGGGENACLQKRGDIYGSLKAHVVVKGKQEGI